MNGSRILQLFKSRETRTAWFVAIAADCLQILILPLFMEGVFSPADVLIDVGVALFLTRLIGWHWAFLPSLLAELVPGLDLFPTWTAAVLYVTLQRGRPSRPDIREERLIPHKFLNS